MAFETLNMRRFICDVCGDAYEVLNTPFDDAKRLARRVGWWISSGRDHGAKCPACSRKMGKRRNSVGRVERVPQVCDALAAGMIDDERAQEYLGVSDRRFRAVIDEFTLSGTVDGERPWEWSDGNADSSA